ncbi:MAG TPA: type II toxin-antitoxin system HicA family toxin [Bacillota bacterium]|nr:type II toxin-antitoxin system HicA family toxin [Bacillota bacterium]
MKPRELIKLLESDGWYLDRVQGSHYAMRHPNKPVQPVIPYNNKDLKRGTLAKIRKQAGLDNPACGN